MMVNRCMLLLTDELIAEGIEDPLAESFTLAAIWEDLCRHAGEAPPEEVQRRLGGSLAAVQGSVPIEVDDSPMIAPPSSIS